MELPISANVPSSASSLKTVESKMDETSSQALQLLEAPLIGLCSKPFHLLSIQEKRKELGRIRNLRGNFPGWRAAVADQAEGEKKKVENEEKTNTISDSLGDLLKL